MRLLSGGVTASATETKAKLAINVSATALIFDLKNIAENIVNF